MTSATKIVKSFEERLVTIISSKEENQAQTKDLNAGIDLVIYTDELADEVHSKIRELIINKQYPVKEVVWFNYAGSNRWHFRFKY